MSENTSLLSITNKPFPLFKKWYEEATLSEINDPNAMNLSTVNEYLKPSSRMVLLKEFDSQGFVFYTNIKSKKGTSILNNPNVALLFHWKSLLRQIRIEGKIIQVTDIEADNYFDSRPENSKIGAWSSLQSNELLDRNALEENIKYYKKKFYNKVITRPPFWTGFRVEPVLIEFWQDMPFRLHDRLEFKKNNSDWNARKLFP